ncbi:MAG: VOC family protein [Chloroflexi bacterium]|nr:VOC family protein [Chloroflexota bacterium]
MAFAPGTPMWADLGTSDLPASLQFYGQLFGWQGEDLGEQAGHYHFLRQNGKMVGGAGPLMMPQQPVAWATVISAADAAATAKAVQDGGGRVLSGPMDVMGQGTLVVCADPSGAVFTAWQPTAGNVGAELTSTPNSLCWNELATRDLTGAKQFYPRVFPWGVVSNPMPHGREYVEWQVDGRSVAGATGMGDDYPPTVPPHWLTYFAVADADATLSQAQKLGATLLAPAMDIPQGRFGVLRDPQGATFGVIRLASA